jgi:hypothetical protein
MIQALLISNSGPIAFIGISDANIRRLRAGLPLEIDLKEFTRGEDHVNRVIIHLAHTYTEVLEDMIEHGLPVNKQMRKMAKALDEELAKEE